MAFGASLEVLTSAELKVLIARAPLCFLAVAFGGGRLLGSVLFCFGGGRTSPCPPSRPPPRRPAHSRAVHRTREQVCGAIGNVFSLAKKSASVAETEIGIGATCAWGAGALDADTTVALYFEVANQPAAAGAAGAAGGMGQGGGQRYIQLLTSYQVCAARAPRGSGPLVLSTRRAPRRGLGWSARVSVWWRPARRRRPWLRPRPPAALPSPPYNPLRMPPRAAQHASGAFRLRVTTLAHTYTETANLAEVARGFDQEAAAVLMARIAVHKTLTEEPFDILRWIDRMLIRVGAPPAAVAAAAHPLRALCAALARGGDWPSALPSARCKAQAPPALRDPRPRRPPVARSWSRSSPTTARTTPPRSG